MLYKNIPNREIDMAGRLKTFLVGLVLGALIAFFLGMNFGKGAPLLSNPFDRDIKGTIKGKAEEMAEGAREKIHAATKPDGAKK
jgi:hypothetical protein